MRRVVAYCCTRNLYYYAYLTIQQLCTYNTLDAIYLFVEDNTFNYDFKHLPVHIIVDNGQQWFNNKSAAWSVPLTYMSYLRLCLPFLLPNESLVLSLDIDTLVIDNIEHLFELDMTNYYIAGCLEPKKTSYRKNLYTNFGVILMNLDKIRQDKMHEYWLKIANSDHYFWECGEQDIVNVTCKNAIYILPSIYNWCPFCYTKEELNAKLEIKIRHFAGDKNWIQSPFLYNLKRKFIQPLS